MAATLAIAGPAFAQNHYPLEIINIKPIGSAPNGLDANNRIYRAYPGVEYNIRAGVQGGTYPYTFSLSNAPSGMSIDGRGEIRWTNPQANASPTITVRDSRGATVSATWPITVSGTTFRFVDSVNGRNAANNGCSSACGTGTATNPWRTIKDYALNAPPRSILYFRTGVYGVLDMSRAGLDGPWERVEFNEVSRGAIWLEYPGDSAVIDFGYREGVEWGPAIRITGDNIWIDGLETRNSHLIGFQVAPTAALRGPTFRRLYMHHHGPGADGSNAAPISVMTSVPLLSSGAIYQDNVFANVQTCTIKIYSQTNILIEDNVTRDSEAGPELKGDAVRFTIRGDTFENIANIAIGGNMHPASDASRINGEIAFNNIEAQYTLDLNQDGLAGRIYSYRNTFRGRVRVRNVDGTDGPFSFTNNVILNSDPGDKILRQSVSAPSRIVVGTNLTGSLTEGIVDALGNLTNNFAQWIGIHGHQLGGDDESAPDPPTNLRIMQ